MLLAYVFRSFMARRRANAVTIVSIALFVAGGSLGLSYYRSLDQILRGSAPADNVIVLAEGALTELESMLPLPTAQKIMHEHPLAVRELVSSVFLDKVHVNTFSDATPIRGIDDQSLRVHHVTVVTGRPPERGTLEIMIGRGVAKRFPQLTVGSDMPLPSGAAKITGVFTAGHGPYEDEVWTPRAALELHLKTDVTSSVTFVAERADLVPSIVERINQSKDLDAHAFSLATYRADGAGLAAIAKMLLVMLVLLFVVTIFAIAKTMNAAVSIRMPELAAMAALGYRRGLLARLVAIEAILLALVGGLVGVALGELARSLIGHVTFGITVELTFTALAPLIALGLAVVVGLVGGFLPAFAVRRLSILEALR